jgi:polysaccharide deacetylase family protein (PEP-CTERM system associated)
MPERRGSVINALTIDVEDYFQVEGFAGVIARSEWESYPSRVVATTQLILQMLNAAGVQATFFVLGWVAERYPSLVQEIAAEGHEIASHGYWHQLVYQQKPEEFAEDVARSLRVIRNACPDAEIIGYRAPSFSITQQSLWAWDLLSDLGIKYDSSVFPITGHDTYGMADAPRVASQVTPRLYEFPLSTVRYFGRNWPVAGGGYFRLMPFRLTCHAIRRINAENQPAVVYLHPWEFDPDQPRIGAAPWRSRFRHYVNLRKTEKRLQMLLERFAFAPVQEVFRASLDEMRGAPGVP